MKTCPTCGQPVDEDWKDYYCQCGCGISCKATDPKADEKIAEWKLKHKCKVRK
jgi:hypothetical protein